MLPVINKVGGSLRTASTLQLDKLDQVTDSAASAVEAVDQAVRTVSSAVKRPAQKAAGVAAGVTHGWSRFRTSRNWRDAVDEARAAAARAEQDIEDELKAPANAPSAGRITGAHCPRGPTPGARHRGSKATRVGHCFHGGVLWGILGGRVNSRRRAGRLGLWVEVAGREGPGRRRGMRRWEEGESACPYTVAVRTTAELREAFHRFFEERGICACPRTR